MIVAFLFLIDIHHFTTYTKKNRDIFQEILDKYPSGGVPIDSDLIFHYRLIKIDGCCGIDYSRNLPEQEAAYFRRFPANCGDIQFVMLTHNERYR